MEGLEPPYLAASDPKSDVSANFTTWALRAAKVMDLVETKHTGFLIFSHKSRAIPNVNCAGVRAHDAFFRKFVCNGNVS